MSIHPVELSKNRPWLIEPTRLEKKRRSRNFDLFFGIVTLAICFVVDPGILRDDGLAAPYCLSIYLMAGLAWIALLTWHFCNFGPRGHAVVVGVFATASILSGIIALPLLPLSIFLIPIGIGLLSLTTVVTWFVYSRALFRALGFAHGPRQGFFIFTGFAAGIIIILLGLAPQLRLEASFAQIAEGKRNNWADEADSLRPWKYFIYEANWINCYLKYRINEGADVQVKELYHRVTGGDLGYIYRKKKF
ncbi:MAG: hypothetical protein HY286_01245 [Planctomycetes bacterium]|nr:hypothetical protein [Planctomycetota bacterium]